ncbi:dipeptidase [Rhizobium sp. CNPSo 3968]|uniref:dipeptidase n=1 Tax=Rhizobium sp. CNPSo 3968 TaxID=3021408 RepID=UPI00254B57A0|nr:dipeptidase [Rhizobium sp. CNPSo 3968]MDK4717908.1 dipeptidase [Rhizobium sp. CNPSo 3968]
MKENVPIFDGHNDILLKLYNQRSDDPARAFIHGNKSFHIDLPKARSGGLFGGLFALYSPSHDKISFAGMTGGSYRIPMPAPLVISEAQPSVLAELSILLRIERESNGAVLRCMSTREIRAARDSGALAVVVHLEGAEAIDEDLHFLDILYGCGLRSIGPVWSRNNIFGYGVPFHFPASPDLGPGLTHAGERLIKACNRMKILVDLSHITEMGFWDVARLSTAPLVATHSNAHALCPSPRNLTDKQLDAIRDTGGLVGLNFATCFLRNDGEMRTDTPIDLLIEQLDYLLERVGEDHVGLGSDFDGAAIPEAIGSSAGLPVLMDSLRTKGYSDTLLLKIASENWLSVLARTID